MKDDSFENIWKQKETNKNSPFLLYYRPSVKSLGEMWLNRECEVCELCMICGSTLKHERTSHINPQIISIFLPFFFFLAHTENTQITVMNKMN